MDAARAVERAVVIPPVSLPPKPPPVPVTSRKMQQLSQTFSVCVVQGLCIMYEQLSQFTAQDPPCTQQKQLLTKTFDNNFTGIHTKRRCNISLVHCGILCSACDFDNITINHSGNGGLRLHIEVALSCCQHRALDAARSHLHGPCGIAGLNDRDIRLRHDTRYM